MSDLEEKLIEVGRKHGISRVHYPSGVQCRCIDGPMGHFLIEVKQAFTDAGWMKVFDDNVTIHSIDSTPVAEPSGTERYGVQYRIDEDDAFHFAGDMNALKEANGFMTGQEFYDRFEWQLGNTTFQTWYERDRPEEAHGVLDRELILKVAKKAAGIE